MCTKSERIYIVYIFNFYILRNLYVSQLYNITYSIILGWFINKFIDN